MINPSVDAIQLRSPSRRPPVDKGEETAEVNTINTRDKVALVIGYTALSVELSNVVHFQSPYLGVHSSVLAVGIFGYKAVTGKARMRALKKQQTDI